jgi:hypothetical protein
VPKRPINTDVPAPQEERQQERTRGGQPQRPEKSPPAHPRTRQPKPLAPKLLAGLVVLAIGFIIVAIVGGSGGSGESTEATAPAVAPATAPAAEEPSGEQAPSAQSAESLGYPGFATNNTSRVGGANAAANAAAVALAVFPSTTASQRPAAVAVVDESEPTTALAAAVLMAPPVRAPILFARNGSLPEESSVALEALDPSGSADTGGASAFAVGSLGPATIPVDGRVQPTAAGAASGNPYGAAVAVAAIRERLAGPPSHFVVAPLSEPDIAAPAAAWAARSGDPVLFAELDHLPGPTAAMLRHHPKAPVYVLGPSSAISSKVVREIGAISRQVKRVSGEDPVANAVAFARYHDGDFGWNVNDPGHGFVLVRSDSPLDAAAASPLSASGTWGPLLLTDDAGTLPAEVRNYFLDVKPGYTNNPTRAFYNRVWVIGDQEAIDVNQQAEVNELAELAKIGTEE